MPRRRRNKSGALAVVEPTTFPVTIVRLVPPYIEVGAYAYIGETLPAEGETITVRSMLSPWGPRLHEINACVTRVDPKAETPISAAAVEAG